MQQKLDQPIAARSSNLEEQPTYNYRLAESRFFFVFCLVWSYPARNGTVFVNLPSSFCAQRFKNFVMVGMLGKTVVPMRAQAGEDFRSDGTASSLSSLIVFALPSRRHPQHCGRRNLAALACWSPNYPGSWCCFDTPTHCRLPCCPTTVVVVSLQISTAYGICHRHYCRDSSGFNFDPSASLPFVPTCQRIDQRRCSFTHKLIVRLHLQKAKVCPREVQVPGNCSFSLLACLLAWTSKK